MQLRSSLVLVLALAACGGDDDDAPPPQPGQPGAPAPAAAVDPNKKMLSPQVKIEDRVASPAEKASLRHQFKDRDFAPEQNNRDPFQSFVITQPGMQANENKLPVARTPKCTRDDQFVATNFTYSDLRLVGIVAQGTQRKALMMDPTNFGHIIKRNDCVGKEKAVVKDIGTGYITFVIEPDDAPAGSNAEEHSIQLYPNQLPVTALPSDAPATIKTQAPVVTPPPAPAPSKGSQSPPVEQAPPLKTK